MAKIKHQMSIDDEIQHILEVMSMLDVDDESYCIATRNLQTLCEARSKKPARIIESEVIVMAITEITGILLVLNYERLNVIATKAMMLIRRH